MFRMFSYSLVSEEEKQEKQEKQEQLQLLQQTLQNFLKETKMDVSQISTREIYLASLAISLKKGASYREQMEARSAWDKFFKDIIKNKPGEVDDDEILVLLDELNEEINITFKGPYLHLRASLVRELNALKPKGQQAESLKYLGLFSSDISGQMEDQKERITKLRNFFEKKGIDVSQIQLDEDHFTYPLPEEKFSSELEKTRYAKQMKLVWGNISEIDDPHHDIMFDFLESGQCEIGFSKHHYNWETLNKARVEKTQKVIQQVKDSYREAIIVADVYPKVLGDLIGDYIVGPGPKKT